MAEIKLAEALLRRKELQLKVDQLHKINQQGLFETRVQRVRVTDSVDDLTAQVPKLKLEQVTAGYDWYAKRLRLIDALIQQANWTTSLILEDPSVMEDYREKL